MMSLSFSKFCFRPRTMLRLFSNEAAIADSPVISAGKKNLSQSPWKMNFLVKLVRDKWVPDALAQMKFSPKHKARDVAKILNRAATLANIRHGAIPEELYVKEIMVTKGMQHKRMRIMGRGRTGFGYKRWSHVTLKVEVINFDERILKAESKGQKDLWLQRKLLVQQLKESPREYVLKKPEKKPRRQAAMQQEEE